jgi:hypothetical protein
MIIVHLFNITTDCNAVLPAFQNIMKLKIQLYHLWNSFNATKICWPFTCYLWVHFVHSFLWKLMCSSCVYKYYHYIIIRSIYFKTSLLLSPLINFDAISTMAFCSSCDINDNDREECIINSHYTENHVSCSALLFCVVYCMVCVQFSNSHATHLEGLVLSNWLLWMKFLVDFLSPSKQIPG